MKPILSITYMKILSIINIDISIFVSDLIKIDKEKRFKKEQKKQNKYRKKFILIYSRTPTDALPNNSLSIYSPNICIQSALLKRPSRLQRHSKKVLPRIALI